MSFNRVEVDQVYQSSSWSGYFLYMWCELFIFLPLNDLSKLNMNLS